MNIVDDKEFNKLFEKISEASDKFGAISLHGLAVLKGKNPDIGTVHAINIGMAAASGLLRATASMMTPGDELPMQDHVLFAAVMTALCMEIDRSDRTKMVFNYHPGIIGDTLDFLERATGRKFDGIMDQPMVKAGREVQAEAANPLKTFMEARAANPPPSV